MFRHSCTKIRDGPGGAVLWSGNRARPCPASMHSCKLYCLCTQPRRPTCTTPGYNVNTINMHVRLFTWAHTCQHCLYLLVAPCLSYHWTLRKHHAQCFWRNSQKPVPPPGQAWEMYAICICVKLRIPVRSRVVPHLNGAVLLRLRSLMGHRAAGHTCRCDGCVVCKL